MPERESPKRTIFVNGGLEPLQMVLEPDTGRCASEEAKLQRGWTRGGALKRKLGPIGGGLGVPHRLEKGTSASEDVGPERGGL